VTGGAAIAAYRLHSGLGRIGVSSAMLVAHRASSDPTVAEIRRSRWPLARLRRARTARAIANDLRYYDETKLATLEALSDDRAADGADLVASLPATDVLNLHWVAGFLDYRRFFSALPKASPLVWTLHDMNPFSGGCHYALGCERFKSCCGACPQLGSRDPNDLTAAIHARKADALKRLSPQTTRIVTPSQWMANEAKGSSLLGRFDIQCVPNGVDTQIFRPRGREAARARLGLPQDRAIAMFSSHVVQNHRKGFDLLAEVFRSLPKDPPVTLVSVGASAGAETKLDERHHPLGEIRDETDMSFALSAADVFVCPTRADNFPNVILEAAACGVPTVAFDVGGVSDLVRPGETGLLAPANNVPALRDAIMATLSDATMRERLSGECRARAVARYSLEVQAGAYRNIYEELLATSSALRTAART
jgi:glycosyltransferase involved in cell wall biosynthesis